MRVVHFHIKVNLKNWKCKTKFEVKRVLDFRLKLAPPLVPDRERHAQPAGGGPGKGPGEGRRVLVGLFV